MVKEALRRLLWLAPTLLIVTVPTFWAITRSTDRVRGGAPETIPLFFNRSPVDARERALSAVAQIAAGGDGSDRAAADLDRLGGAALPHVLSQLDALNPEARGRVALALAPVARRMGVGSTELDSPESAVLFFRHYWEEHAIDFRPSVVHRTVQRFAERPSSLRRSEVVELDTLALEDLVGAMRSLSGIGDVARLRPVSEVAAQIVRAPPGSRPLVVPEAASLTTARRIVAHWRGFWRRHRTEFVTLSGTRRLGATVTETRYGHWLERVLESIVGDPASSDTDVGGTAPAPAREPPTRLNGRISITLGLVLVGLLAGQPLSVLAGAYSAIRRGTPRDDRVGTAQLAFAGAFAGLVAAGALSRGMVGAAAGTALVGALLALRQHRAVQRYTNESPHLRTAIAFGASPSRVLWNNLRLAAALAFALAVTDLPAVVTASFAMERVFSLHGLGEATAEAARRGDATFLMALALAGATLLGVSQIAADMVLKAADPRTRATGLPDAREVFR